MMRRAPCCSLGHQLACVSCKLLRAFLTVRYVFASLSFAWSSKVLCGAAPQEAFKAGLGGGSPAEPLICPELMQLAAKTKAMSLQLGGEDVDLPSNATVLMHHGFSPLRSQAAQSIEVVTKSITDHIHIALKFGDNAVKSFMPQGDFGTTTSLPPQMSPRLQSCFWAIRTM